MTATVSAAVLPVSFAASATRDLRTISPSTGQVRMLKIRSASQCPVSARTAAAVLPGNFNADSADHQQAVIQMQSGGFQREVQRLKQI